MAPIWAKWTPWVLLPFLHVLAEYGELWTGYLPRNWYYLPAGEVLAHWPQSFWYWHASPPGLQLLQGFFGLLHPIPPQLLASLFLGFLHAASFTAVWSAFSRMPLPKPLVWAFLLWLLNPAVLFQAGQFHGTTMAMHVLAIAAAGRWLWPKHFWECLWWLLATTVWFRPLFGPLFLVLLLLPFAKTWWPKRRWSWVLPFGLMLFLPVKNGLQFGQFSGSSWQWRNLAAHIPPGKPEPINFERRFDSLPYFETQLGFKDEDSLRNRFGTCSVCFLGGHNDLRFFEVNRAYRKALIEHASWRHSLLTAAYGGLSYLSHPVADNEYQRERLNHSKSLTRFFFWGNLPDFFLDNSAIRLSLMTLFWPWLMWIFCRRWKKWTAEERLLLALLVGMSLAYATLDPNESNRMRMESMGIFWLMAGAWSRSKKAILAIKPKRDR